MSERVAGSEEHRTAALNLWAHAGRIDRLWPRLLAGLEPPDAWLGPDCRDARPRPREDYWIAEADGDEVGLVWIGRPSRLTRTLGLGLFREHRGRGLGPILRDAALVLCFSNPIVWKVEAEIVTSNQAALAALRRRDDPMVEEGLRRASVEIEGARHGRLLLGLTRDEWERRRARSSPNADGGMLDG